MSPDRKSQVLAAAMQCFAEKGFEATSIVDIEVAAGLSPGSGATYRHFGSKREMLEAGIAAIRRSNAEATEPVITSMIDSAYAGIDLGRRNHILSTLLFRDLGQFPDLGQQVADEVVEDLYRVAADRLAVISPNGDAEALSVVFSGAMLSYSLLEATLDTHALGVGDDRFAAAWARLLELVIADELDCEESE